MRNKFLFWHNTTCKCLLYNIMRHKTVTNLIVINKNQSFYWTEFLSFEQVLQDSVNQSGLIFEGAKKVLSLKTDTFVLTLWTQQGILKMIKQHETLLSQLTCTQNSYIHILCHTWLSQIFAYWAFMVASITALKRF